jgi:hypothetical protein
MSGPPQRQPESPFAPRKDADRKRDGEDVCVTIKPAILDDPLGNAPVSSPDDLQKQIAVFRFCEEALQKRAAGSSRDWLWRIKGKVAAYCRHTLEARQEDDASPWPVLLSESERREIVRWHPLLNDTSPAASRAETCPDWLTALRERVAAFTSRLRESRSSAARDN